MGHSVDQKLAISLHRGQFDPKFHVEGVAPPIIFARIVRPGPVSIGAQKCKTADSGIKLYFAWRKSATKFLCVKTVSKKVVRHSLA